MKLNLLQLSSAPGKIVLENKSLYTEVYQRYSGKFVWRQWGKRIPSLQSSRTIALIFGHALLKNKPQTKCFSKENFSWYFSVRSKLGLKGGSNLLDISYHTFFCRNFEGEDFYSDACNTDLQRLFFLPKKRRCGLKFILGFDTRRKKTVNEILWIPFFNEYLNLI